MTAIFKRELSAYFHSVTGWLFAAASICLAGLYFFALNLMYGYGNVGETISSILFLLLLTVPVLSMRILAEERKQKTDQLILTAPVSVSGIVFGKYLAMAAVFTIPVLVMSLFPLILTRYGSVAIGESYTAILVYYLFGLSCIAVGLFVSSLTESQVIAAVVSFAVLFTGYMMSAITSLISQSGNWLTKILGAFDFNARLNDMLGGTLDLKAVLYFLTIIVVFLFLTVQSIQKRRYHISVKTLKVGAYSTGMIVLVLGIAVFVNMAASALPTNLTTLDVTSRKLYSLTDTTKNLLKGLTEDVTIYVLDSEKAQDETLARTLRQYADLSSHVSVVYKDPVVAPDFYKNYSDDLTVNSLVVESDRRFKTVNYRDIYESSFDYATYSSTVTGYDAEGLITSAIAYVTSDSAPVVYALNGHNELELQASFVNGLKKENADLADLTLLTQDGVPEDADGVLILSPQNDLTEDDADKLTAYLDAGGSILMETVYTDNFSEKMPNLSKVLDYFGLSIQDGLVIEKDTSRMYQNPIYLLPEVLSDSLTQGVYGSKFDYIMMPYAQAVQTQDREDVEVTQLLTTSESAFVKTGLEEADELKEEEGDAKGPFAVGVKAVKTLESGNASLYLYTSQLLFTEEANQYTMDNNLKLFTNAVNAMTGETDSVSIPVKSYETAHLTVPTSQAVMLGIVFMAVIPIGLLLCGIIIWVRRRKR